MVGNENTCSPHPMFSHLGMPGDELWLYATEIKDGILA